MSPILLILIMLVVQVAAYFLFVRLKLRLAPHLLPIGIVALHLFVFPPMYFPANPENEFQCGLPILAIRLGFWTFGCGSTIICHLFCWLGSKAQKSLPPETR